MNSRNQGLDLPGRALFLCAAAGCAVLGMACGGSGGGAEPDAQVGWAPLPALPEAVSNNAVASVESEGGCMVFSFLGVDSSLAQEGIHRRAYRFRQGDEDWLAMPDVPGSPRLAANAVGLRGDPFVLGGYEVAPGGSETSTTGLYRFDLQWGRWEEKAPLPVPIDDAAVAVWRERYIVVVSGWSNTGNVDAVQIYDGESDSWLAGTAFPGTTVFGPAMAIAGDELILIDGVASGALGFRLVNQAWRGTLDPDDPGTIAWTDLGEHPGPARYRAAPGVSPDGSMWFHGGTAEPYNFDGLRYDNGQPSAPLASTLRYREGSFSEGALVDKPSATMDHRALATCGQRLISVGGMVAGPMATDQVWSIVP